MTVPGSNNPPRPGPGGFSGIASPFSLARLTRTVVWSELKLWDSEVVVPAFIEHHMKRSGIRFQESLQLGLTPISQRLPKSIDSSQSSSTSNNIWVETSVRFNPFSTRWKSSHHRHKPRLRLHPFNPSSDLRKIIERESAFGGYVCVGEEGDVGNRVIVDEEVIFS